MAANTCPQCGWENPEDYRICIRCAASLALHCPECNRLVPAGNKFCGHCGTKIEAAHGYDSFQAEPSQASLNSIELMVSRLRSKMPASFVREIQAEASEALGQRREVTVMFVDVANFTATSRRLGSEEIFVMMNELIDRMVDVIYRYEGTIDKFTGDGLIALFGIPFNHENDPERAVRVALEIHKSVAPLKTLLKTQHDLDLGIRIGINTGVVIVGKLGSELHMEYTVIGDTVNLASRLEAQAEPGSTLISYQTYKRVRGIFTFEIVPPVLLKGYNQPVQVFKPTGIRKTIVRMRGESTFQIPMIGRQGPFTLLEETLSQVKSEKTSRLIAISGEAGLGKTRLIEEFRKSLVGSGTRFHYGSSGTFMRVTPYHVIRKLLKSIMHIADSDSTGDQLQAANLHLSFLGLEEKEILPYILYVLEIPQESPLAESQLRMLDAPVLQKQTHAALRAVFAAEAKLSEIIYVFDDLHWADQASRDFLEYFCHAIDQNPILLILVSRNFQASPVLQPHTESTLQSQGKLFQMDIKPLTEQEAILFVNNILRNSEPRLDIIKQEICRRAEGNPYFIEELIRLVIEKEGLIQAAGGWRTTPLVDEVLAEIPESLRDIILARFDRLPSTLQQILQKAAILGPSFALFLLQTQLDVDEKTLDHSLSLLEQKEFLTLTQEGLDRIYSFKQTIVREAIYNTILRRDRMTYHYQAAQTIKTFTFWLPGERSEILAYHLSQSMKPIEAIKYLIAAGENALERFANKIATKHFRDALALFKEGEPFDPYDKARTEVGLGKALKYAGEFEEAASVLKDAIHELSDFSSGAIQAGAPVLDLLVEAYREKADLRAREGRLDDGLVLLEQGIEKLGPSPEARHPSLWRKLIDRLAWIYFRQGKLELASETAALALANEAVWGNDDPSTLASLNNTMGGISWMQSRYDEAISYVQNSLEIYKRMDYFWGRAIASTNLGVLHFTSGNWVDAVRYFEQAEAIQIEYSYTPDRPTNLKNLGEVLMNLGYHKSARKHLTNSQQISKQLGMRINEAYAEIGLCRLSIYESNFPDARRHHHNASALLEESADEVDDRNISLMLLDALIISEAGELERACSLSEQALEMAEESGFLAEKSEAQRVYGQICTRLGKYELAQGVLQDAISLAREQDNPYKEAQAHYELGILHQVQSQLDQEQDHHLDAAKTELNLAIKLFTQLGASYDLEKAAKALNPLGREYPKNIPSTD